MVLHIGVPGPSVSPAGRAEAGVRSTHAAMTTGQPVIRVPEEFTVIEVPGTVIREIQADAAVDNVKGSGPEISRLAGQPQ